MIFGISPSEAEACPDVGEEPGVRGLPVQQSAGARPDVGLGDEPEGTEQVEMPGRLDRIDADSWDTEVAADRLGDLAEGDTLVADRVCLGPGGRVFQGQAGQTGGAELVDGRPPVAGVAVYPGAMG